MEEVRSKRDYLRRIALGIPALVFMLLAGLVIPRPRSRSLIDRGIGLPRAAGTRYIDWLRDLSRSPDLLVLIVLALFMPLVLTLPVVPVRVVLSLGLALVAPGYALTAALFPKRDDIDLPVRAALSVGLSIALVPAFAFLLSALPWRIRTISIAISLAIWIIILSLVAVRRRLAVAESVAEVEPGQTSHVPWQSRLTQLRQHRFEISLVVLALVFLAGVAIWSGGNSEGKPTEFYILGANGQAEAFPRQVTTQDNVTVTLGIANGSEDHERFRVEIWEVDADTTDGARLVKRDGPFVLDSDESTEWSTSWRMSQPGDDQRLQFLLFAGDDQEPLRWLELWLDVVGP